MCSYIDCFQMKSHSSSSSSVDCFAFFCLEIMIDFSVSSVSAFNYLLFCLKYFEFSYKSANFSSSVKTPTFFEFLASSGRILQCRWTSIYIISLMSLSYFASPSFSWLLSRLRCDTEISGFVAMKILDQRCLIRGSEKNFVRTLLLFSRNTQANRILSTRSVKFGNGRRVVHGKIRVSIFTMFASHIRGSGRASSSIMNARICWM